MCMRPLVKFSPVKSQLLESWRNNFSKSNDWKLGVRTHGRVSASRSATKKLVKGNLPVCTGLYFLYYKKRSADIHQAEVPEYFWKTVAPTPLRVWALFVPDRSSADNICVVTVIFFAFFSLPSWRALLWRRTHPVTIRLVIE